jgi:hypothetical protein
VAVPAEESPLRLTVHSLPAPHVDDDARRTAVGRLKMLLVLLVCALPVIASYVTYYVIRPDGRTNYGDLIQPARPIPPDLPLADLQGQGVKAQSLRGQWLIVVVAGGECTPVCEQLLWLQRQLREAVGRDKDRVEKLWLIPDAATPSPRTLEAVRAGAPATLLRVPRDAMRQWLEPGAGHELDQHLFIVDPMGNWMMRAPINPDPSRMKRDLEKLLRASAGWDTPGR